MIRVISPAAHCDKVIKSRPSQGQSQGEPVVISWIKGLFVGASSNAGRCLVCSSADLSELAPEAYHCNGCGYDGGDGYAAFLADKERTRLRVLDIDAVKKLVHATLRNARLTVIAALGGMCDDESGWSFSLGETGAMQDLGAEERERMRNERDAGFASARAKVLGLEPALSVLVEKGFDGQALLTQLETLRDESEASLQKFIANAGRAFS